MPRIPFAVLLASFASLAYTATEHAATQTEAVPGLGTVTISEASVFDGALIEITITPATGTVDDARFNPIVLIDTGRYPSTPPEIPERSKLTLRAAGSQTTAQGSIWGEQNCQWIAGPGGHGPSLPVKSRRAADGSSLTFILFRGLFQTPVPISFRWIALDAGTVTPEETCDPAVGQGQPGNVGVKRDIVTGSFTFTGDITTLTPVIPPPVRPIDSDTTAPVSFDPDGDGIRNDWLIAGKSAAAPKSPIRGEVTPNTVTLKLPKVPRGAKLRVYGKTGNHPYRVVTTTIERRVRVRGLKAATRYQFKVVAVKAGRQTAASEPITIKTKRKTRR